MTRPISLLSVALGLAVQAATLPLNSSDSTVEFLAVGRPSLIKIRGSADESSLDGRLRIDQGTLSGTATVKLDAFDTGIELRNRHLREKYFETQKYPEARLELEPTRLTGESTPFAGRLTLHGVTRAVTGTVSHAGGAPPFAFDLQLKLSDFGIPVPKFMGITVGENVSITAKVSRL